MFQSEFFKCRMQNAHRFAVGSLFLRWRWRRARAESGRAATGSSKRGPLATHNAERAPRISPAHGKARARDARHAGHGRDSERVGLIQLARTGSGAAATPRAKGAYPAHRSTSCWVAFAFAGHRRVASRSAAAVKKSFWSRLARTPSTELRRADVHEYVVAV